MAIKGIFSFFKRKPNPVDLLQEAIKRNPNGFQMVLLNKPSEWSKWGIGGDIHLGKYNELSYHGDKKLNDAILELVEELKTPVSAEDLGAMKSFQARTREILSTLDADQQINIGTEDTPVFVTLSYDWYYWDDSVHVVLVEGYTSPRFKGKKEGRISWNEMYGYVYSMPPGKNEGRDWFRPRIATNK